MSTSVISAYTNADHPCLTLSSSQGHWVSMWPAAQRKDTNVRCEGLWQSGSQLRLEQMYGCCGHLGPSYRHGISAEPERFVP